MCVWNVVCGMLRCQVTVVQKSQAQVAELEAQSAASAQHLAAKQAELAAKQTELVESQQLVQVVHYLFKLPIPFVPMLITINQCPIVQGKHQVLHTCMMLCDCWRILQPATLIVSSRERTAPTRKASLTTKVLTSPGDQRSQYQQLVGIYA